MNTWCEGKVVEKKQWNADLFSLFIDARISPFIAGQFTQISLDHESKELFRPLSFVNAPFDPILEFYFDIVKEGRLSPMLAKLNRQDILWVKQKASGRFILSNVPPAPTLWLMATGTGLGVFLSLLKANEAWEKFQTIVLVHSVRRVSALTHQRLIKDWQEKFPGRFYWIPIVTGEVNLGTLSERIPVLLNSGKLETLVQIELSSLSSQVMLCGNPEMISQVSECLLARGLRRNNFNDTGQVTAESYWKLKI